ncbi:MAG: hypothetical protein A2150_07365 [Candidatus Muproteobacteria bacterium RBG_16_64_11]|uniref:Uncharacterized protein n=1 Tax=Candidatus Muproteobacteria bacterium RBG_16_64_11 TaxID=1817758 RepID=A0A1F6THQ7_9PROT|nr:MAG: hypothetical protein A2150_07365 [Candidatus Muproteobacteria bacterium RBG_16_64_11]
MTFKELIQCLADEIGYHQVPLNNRAHQVNDLLEGCALHHELMLRLMGAIYRHNGCRKLADCVTRTVTLDAVAPIRLDVLRSPRTDIDTKRLMDDFCLAITRIFDNDSALSANQNRTAKTVVRAKYGQVIAIDPYRRRLKSWT